MKKSTKIFMSFLFIILFGSMISTAVYVRIMSEKEAQATEEIEQQSDETEQQSQQTTSEIGHNMLQQIFLIVPSLTLV